ncbi:MAG: prolyl oligopeptidase family serine peptidase [Deltaproteobacteria bacterium]
MEETQRFRDQNVTLAGIPGENVEIPSANPVNFHQAMAEPDAAPGIVVDGKFFLPAGTGPFPLILIVPGSLGVGPNHLAHAETLLGEGFAVFVLDPFGQRAIESTIANQTQYSFAASAFDVLAALRVLGEHAAIDATRIAAQGHSRGGSAILMASMRRFADAILGEGKGLVAAYAAYPWCGQQFRDARVGTTRIRAIVGDRDDWVSIQQMQAQIHAITLSGGAASDRIVTGAAHSFDRLGAIEKLADAMVAPTAPTIFLNDDGAMTNPFTGVADANTTDYDLFVAGAKAGFGRSGAHYGGQGDQPALFKADMLAFHRPTLTAHRS